MRLFNYLIIILGVVLFPLSATAQVQQERVAPTTESEYSYLTKEYGSRHAAKGEVKTGYVLEEVASYYLKWTHEGEKEPVVKTIVFKALKRKGEYKPCAILCVCSCSNSDDVEYFCLPTIDADKSLWNKFHKQQQTQDEEWKQVWFWGLSHLSAIYMR